jgi:hypothetical protein
MIVACSTVYDEQVAKHVLLPPEANDQPRNPAIGPRLDYARDAFGVDTSPSSPDGQSPGTGAASRPQGQPWRTLGARVGLRAA